MLEKFLNIFRIPDLRKRVLFTLGILAVYRLGAWIPTPGVNYRTSWNCCSASRADLHLD
jgi:preprotein translocase subunit SecY